MKIEKNKVVSFHYDLKDKSSDYTESSREVGPVVCLYGHGNIVPGLEKAIADKIIGGQVFSHHQTTGWLWSA